MKKYIKPEIEIEEIKLEDIILASNGEETEDGKILNPFDIWGKE